MIARGFKPVGWVAAVAGAALGCYMLSLNVAAERAELAKLEWKIVMAKRDIRSLQTELGTRGRLQQLENWNANVLALSAPTSNQFLDNELTLARFDQREKTFEESGKVQLASAEAPQPRSAPQPAQQAVQQPRVVLAKYEPQAQAPAREPQSLVHRASYSIPEAKPLVAEKKATAEKKPPVEKKSVAEPKKPAKPQQLAEAKSAAKPMPAKKPRMLDDKLIKDISEAAKSEKAGSAGGQ